MPLIEHPVFRAMRGDESDPDLVLDIGPDGKDRSRSGLNMTSVGGAVLGAESGVELNGTSAYLLNSTAHFRSADATGTIVAWVKRTVAGATHRVFSSSDQGTTSYYLFIELAAANQLRILQRSGGTANEIRGETALTSLQYHQLVCVGTGAAYVLYVDGVPEALTVVNGANLGYWFSSTANRDNVVVGGLQHTSLSSPFNGSIPNVRVYSRILSADEIREEYLRVVPRGLRT